MQEVNHQLNQLPSSIRSEVVTHVGHTGGMAPVQLVAHYRAVTQNVMAQKRSRYEPLQPGHEMAGVISDILQGPDLSFLSGAAHEPFPRWITHEIVRFLQAFVNNLATVQVRLEQEAHQSAVQAAQEATRLDTQRYAEEAERRRVQEEAARQLSQRRA